MRARSLEGLRQLATDGSATDECKPGGTLCQIEHRFVGQITGLRQPGDRWTRSARAGCDHRPFEPQNLPPDFNLIRTGKLRLAQEYIHAKPGKALRRIMGAEVGAQLAHTFHDEREICLDRPIYLDPETACLSCIEKGPRRTDEPLGGDASHDKTVPTQQVLFNQRHLRPKSCRPGCRHQPGCPRPNDDQVVARGGRRILPIGR